MAMFDGPASLPNGWRWSRLGQVIRRIEHKVTPSNDPSEPFVVVETGDLGGWGPLAAGKDFRLGAEITGTRRRFEPGDILYSRLRPESGRVRVADCAGLCAMDIWVLRVAGSATQEFIAHYLRSKPVRLHAARVSEGGNVPRVPYDAFENIPVPLPPLAEQAHIVEVLREADGVRTRQRALGLHLCNVLPEVLERFTSLAPSQWCPLDSLATLTVGRVAKDGDRLALERPVILSGDLRLGHINGHGLKRAQFSPELAVHGTVQVNDLLLPATSSVKRAPRRIGLVDKALASTRAIMGAHLIRIRLKDSGVSAAYLLAWLLSSAGERALERASSQVQGRSRHTVEALSRIEVPVPPIEEQIAIANRAAEVIAIADRVLAASSTHDEAFDALLTYAVLGEVSAAWRRSHTEVAPMPAMEERLVDAPDEPASITPAGVQRLVAHMSPFQQRVATCLADLDRALVPDAHERFDDFCRQCSIDDSPAASSHVLRVLHQLAGFGLVARTAYPNAQGDFVTAFRPFRESDLSLEQDLKRLTASGEPR